MCEKQSLWDVDEAADHAKASDFSMRGTCFCRVDR